MTRENAIKRAIQDSKSHKIDMVVVNEKLHTDENESEFDADGNSYGYCPLQAVQTLYKYAEIVQTITAPK